MPNFTWKKIGGEVFERMTKYHPSINFTAELNPSKFLDTKLYRDNNRTKCFKYDKEMKTGKRVIRDRCIRAGCPFCFTNSRKEKKLPCNSFLQTKRDEISRIFDKLEALSNCIVKFVYFWKTRKVTSLFVLRDPVIGKANVIYKGTCSCNEFYVGETKLNYEVR